MSNTSIHKPHFNSIQFKSNSPCTIIAENLCVMTAVYQFDRIDSTDLTESRADMNADMCVSIPERQKKNKENYTLKLELKMSR